VSDERDELLRRVLDERVAGGPLVPVPDNSELEDLVEVADLLWEAGQGAPPLQDDPIAAMLGLVPDPNQALDPKALKSARMKAGLSPSQLAQRLTERGWEVNQAKVAGWEGRSSDEVHPALIKAIAEETQTSIDRLTTKREATSHGKTIAAVVRSDRFADLKARWARLRGVPSEMAESMLVSRMNAAVHRGDHPSEEQLLANLEALLGAIEGDGRREP
jgi:transcriptional regulator with XRE-family HTH domain